MFTPPFWVVVEPINTYGSSHGHFLENKIWAKIFIRPNRGLHLVPWGFPFSELDGLLQCFSK